MSPVRNMFLRAEWYPSADQSIADRCRAVGDLLEGQEFTELAGTKWFGLGKSRLDALARPYDLATAATQKGWTRTKRPMGGSMYRLAIWNGCSDIESMGLSGTLLVPSNWPDIVVLSGLRQIPGNRNGWEAVLRLAEKSAVSLGGFALVSSSSLVDVATEGGLSDPSKACYAAFWGNDESGRNTRYVRLGDRSVEVPRRSIACRNWEEVEHPSLQRLKEIAESIGD